MASLLRRLSGWAILVAFTSSLGLGWSAAEHLGLADDADCQPVSLGANRATAQFEAVKPAPATGHCAFCHWQRTVGGARVIGRIAGLFQLQLLDLHPIAPSCAALAAAITHHTSRGPPALVS